MKNIWIIGGTSGIGLAILNKFSQNNYFCFVSGTSLKESLPHNSLFLKCDVSNLDDIDSAIKYFKQNQITLDTIIFNAGVSDAIPLELTTEEYFDKIVNINYKGAFFSIQKSLSLLNNPSNIIFITSISNQRGTPNLSIYASTKAALKSLTQTFALELIPKGIRVNSISPGPIETPMWSKFSIPEEITQQIKTNIANKSPIQRFGTPDEVAEVTFFLSSEQSSYIVGQEIVVDGGMTLLG